MALHQFATLDAYIGAKCETQSERSFDGKTGRGQLDMVSFNLMTFVPFRASASLKRLAEAAWAWCTKQWTLTLAASLR
jgi:hypothetical protein